MNFAFAAASAPLAKPLHGYQLPFISCINLNLIGLLNVATAAAHWLM